MLFTGESSISPSSDQLVDAISSPDNNTALEMTELQQENPSAPHTSQLESPTPVCDEYANKPIENLVMIVVV